MYLGVDIGGTKTLVACFDSDGTLKQQVKFATPDDYESWLEHCKAALAALKCEDFTAGCVAIPGVVDRHNGIGISFGNLPWLDVPIAADVERLTECPILVENDAKVAAFNEAIYVKNEFHNVLYITIGTGIGIAHIKDGVIDFNVDDRGGNSITLSYHGQHIGWERFASGRAIVERFGKKAADITDEATWKVLAHDFAIGFLDLIAKYQPDVIIIGGGVAVHFARFGDLLAAELKQYETPLLRVPPLRPAKRPEEAVIYGCYALIKEHYAHASA